MFYGVDGPNGAAVRAAERAAHFAYLDANRDKMVLGGATLAEDGATRTGSVLIINVRTRAEAEAFAENEPFRKAGAFASITLTRMRRGQWFPENAPKTAEGE